MIVWNNNPYFSQRKNRLPFEPKKLDKVRGRALLTTGQSVGSTQALVSGMNMGNKSALGFMEKLNYINSSSNPVFNAIAFDTEFIEYGEKKVPLQIGIHATQVDYTRQTTQANQKIRTGPEIGKAASARIAKNPASALIVTGIDDQTESYLRGIARKISSGGVPTSEELRNFRYILTYKDMTMAAQPIGKTGYSNYTNVLPLNYFESKVNVVNAKDYLKQYEKAITNLRGAHIQQNVTNPNHMVRDTVMEYLGGHVDSKKPTEFIFQTGSAGDIEFFGDFIGAKRIRGKHNKSGIIKAFGLKGEKNFFVDTEAAARITDRKAIGFKAEEIAKRFGFSDEYLHLANSDAMVALMNSVSITEQAFDLKTLPSSLNIQTGGSYLAKSSFDTRSLGDNIVFQQMFTKEGYDLYKEGRISEITKQQLSQSTWAVGRGDIITVEEIKDSITASGRKTASKWHKEIIFKNNVTNEYSVMAFANEEALQQFAEAIDIAPKTGSGQIARSYLDKRFQSKLADSRSEYAHFFQGGYQGWNTFDTYFGAFEDVISNLGEGLSQEAKDIISSPQELSKVLQSFQKREIGSSLSGAQLEVREAFYRKARTTKALSTSKKIDHFIKMSPELAIKQEGFRSFRSSVHKSFEGISKKDIATRKVLAGNSLNFAVQEIDKAPAFGPSYPIFRGMVADSTDRILDIPNLGRFNTSSPDQLASSIRSHIRSLRKGYNVTRTDSVRASDFATFINELSGKGKIFSRREGNELLQSLSEELGGSARPKYLSEQIANKMYDKIQNDPIGNKIIKQFKIAPTTEVAYDMSGLKTSPRLGETLRDFYTGVLNDYSLTGISRNPATMKMASEQFSASDKYTRNILEKIGEKGPRLSAFGMGDRGAESVIDSIAKGYEKRGVLAKLEIDDAGKTAIKLAYSGGSGMSGASADAMSNVAVMNIPVLNPYNGTITHNGTPMVNSAQFGYKQGKITFGTAFENYLTEMANPRTQARIASYLERGDVSTAQSIIKQIENQNLLNLHKYGGDISEAYRAGSADNPLQIHMKRHRLSYDKLIDDYIAELQQRNPSTRSLTGLDKERISGYILKDPKLLDEMITSGPSNQFKEMAIIAKDIRKAFSDTFGEQDANRLLRFGFTRADQIGENYLPGFGPQAYSPFGKTGISSRSAMVQSLNSVGMSESDYIFTGRTLRTRADVAKNLSTSLQDGSRNYAFRFGIGTEQAYKALGEDAALMKASGRAGRVRGLNIRTAYLDDEMMQKIIAANIEKGNFAQAGALAPSLRDSAALMMSEAYDSFQISNTRKLIGSAKDATSFLDLMQANSIEELQQIIKNGDRAHLTIYSDSYLTNKKSHMRTLRQLGYKGSHTSMLTDIQRLSTGGFSATFSEFTPMLKLSDISGTKGTVNLMSRNSWDQMIKIATDSGALSREQANLLTGVDLFMPMEKKTAAAANEAILNKFVFDLNQSTKVNMEGRRQAVIDLLTTPDAKGLTATGGVKNISSYIRTDATGDIIIDNINAISNAISPIDMANAASVIAKRAGIDSKYYSGGIISGIANIGVARIYDYGGITPMKMNKQMQEQLHRSVFRLFGHDKELLSEAQEAILSPIETSMRKAAEKKSPLYQAIFGDTDLLIAAAGPDAAKDSIIWTKTGAGLDNIRAEYANKYGDFSGRSYDLKELITKDIARGNRSAVEAASDDMLRGTYYNLGLDIDEKTGLSKRFFLELPEEVVVGSGANARSIKYVPMTFRDLKRDEARRFIPDSIQEKQARLLQLTDEYLSPAIDDSIDAAARRARYISSTKGVLGELLIEQNNAIRYNKGFIREQVLSYNESFGSSFWAAPQNLLSSDLLTKTSMDKFLAGAEGATRETYNQFIEASKAIRSVTGPQADAYFTSDAIRSLIETEGKKTGVTFSQESVESIVEQFRGGTVIQMGRSPMKDAGTVGLFRARVLTANEELRAMEVMRIAGEDDSALRERFTNLTKNRIILDPSTAKVIKADFDGDAIVAKFLGLQTRGSSVVIDEAAMAKYKKLEPYFRKYYEGASEVFVDRKGILGDVAKDVMSEALMDRSNQAIEEISRGIASTSKTYTGPMFSATQDLLERSQLMVSGARELGSVESFGYVNKTVSSLEAWSSVLQEMGIGGKRVGDQLQKNLISWEQASMILEQSSEFATQFGRGNFTNEKALVENLKYLGILDEAGNFAGRSGAIASEGIAEHISIYDMKQAVEDTLKFSQGSYRGTGKMYAQGTDAAFDTAIRSWNNVPLSGTLHGGIESTLRGETAEDLSGSMGSKLNRLIRSKDVIDSATEAGERARAKFTGDALGGFNNVLKNPNLKRVGVGALGGLAALMVVGKLTAPNISQTDDRSAVDRSVTTEGTYLNPDVFQGAPGGAGPTMGLPPAYLSPTDSGYNKVMINIRAKNNAGLPDNSVIQYIQSEINSQIPLDFKFNYNSSDTRDHLDKNWLDQQISNVFNYGYTKG